MRSKHTASGLAALTAASRRWGTLVKNSRAARLNLRTIGVFAPFVPDESDIAMQQAITRGTWTPQDERRRCCYEVPAVELERVAPPVDVLLRVDEDLVEENPRRK